MFFFLILNVFESIYFVYNGAPDFEGVSTFLNTQPADYSRCASLTPGNTNPDAAGKVYLDILGKVLVFLLVFRSKLAYDRFWAGRMAIGDMCGFATSIVTDVSSFFEADSEEQVACRAELYRLALATATVMTIHIRKEASDLIKFHDLTKMSFGPADKWLPPGDEDQIRAACKAGVLTEKEAQTLVDAGLSYPNVCATLFSQKLKGGFQAGFIHRNLMMDVDAGMKGMVAAWANASKVAQYPFPFPYLQALTVFNLLFVLSLPVALFQTMGVWTPPAVALITLGFFGLDNVGAQLEDPFGSDDNDLDLGVYLQKAADECYVCLKARDGGEKVVPYNILGVIDH